MHDSNFENQESELLNVSGNEKHSVHSYRKHKFLFTALKINQTRIATAC